MTTTSSRPPRRKGAGKDKLSRESIVGAAIAILDAQGERGLTFRALASRLATGAGALYWYVSGKDELLVAATDAVIVLALQPSGSAEPYQAMRALSLGLFDAIEAHPWLGGQLSREPWQLAVMRIFEGYGQQLETLGLPRSQQFHAASALVHYLLGLAGQYAAGAAALEPAADREDFLAQAADRWARLNPADYPFVHYLSTQLPQHDDREQFLAGLELILAGIAAQKTT